jgi:hypothetical protein
MNPLDDRATQSDAGKQRQCQLVIGFHGLLLFGWLQGNFTTP